MTVKKKNNIEEKEPEFKMIAYKDAIALTQQIYDLLLVQGGPAKAAQFLLMRNGFTVRCPYQDTRWCSSECCLFHLHQQKGNDPTDSHKRLILVFLFRGCIAKPECPENPILINRVLVEA